MSGFPNIAKYEKRITDLEAELAKSEATIDALVAAGDEVVFYVPVGKYEIKKVAAWREAVAKAKGKKYVS